GHLPDRDRVRQAVLAEQGVRMRVPLPLQLVQGGKDRQERLDRAVPLQPGAAVRRPPRDAQLERQRPAFATTSLPLVGSVSTAASPVWPRSIVAKAPRPPSSSLTT